MPRIRTIKPKFWDDLKLAKISRDARLIYIALWNFADDNGVIIAEPVWLKSKIFPYDQIQIKQFEAWLTELEQPGFISLFSYTKEKFYYLPNFSKHQVINRPNTDDVFVPKDRLEEALQHSMNVHGLFSDESPPDRKGMEGNGKDEERKGKRARAPEILFRESEFFDLQKFKCEFAGTKYEVYNLEFYYEKVLNWSNSKNAKKIDWIATARNFMLGDTEKGRGVFQNQNVTDNGTRNSTKGQNPGLDAHKQDLARKLGINIGQG